MQEVQEVQVSWGGLAAIVEHRQVEMVLTNGVHVRGVPQRVLPEAMEIRVRQTSDPALVPKGLTKIPQGWMTVLEVEQKPQWRRLITTLALPAAGLTLLYSVAPALRIDSEEIGRTKRNVAIVGIGAGLGVAGYLIGDSRDAKHIKKLRVVLTPGGDSP